MMRASSILSKNSALAVRHAKMGDQISGLVVPIFEGFSYSGNLLESIDKFTNGAFKSQLEATGHTGKANHVSILYGLDKTLPRVAVVGLGKPFPEAACGTTEAQKSCDSLRKASALAARSLRDSGADHVVFGSVRGSADFQPLAEGAALGLYKFDHYKSQKPEDADKKKEVEAIGLLYEGSLNQECASSFERGTIYARYQNMARDLMNIPANDMTPTIFGQEAQRLLTADGLKVTVRDRKWIEEQKMGSFLSVTNGTDQPPAFVEVEYKTAERPEGPVVLVGKGVTFDSGGISIKPSSGMGMMKGDMGGASVVLSTIAGLAQLGVKTHVVGLIPLCENMPSGRATKPGDVVVARSGTTIEVDNTDAEGRLILCDALDYAKTFKPSMIMNFATLTGAMDVALGFGCTGVFCKNDDLWQRIDKHGRATQDLLWRMPILDDYREAVKASVADLINSTATRSAGSCTAAAFLEAFVDEDMPWAHFDIAGVMHSGKTAGYHVAGMTGRPVRPLIDMIAAMEKK
ncbi:hypothetical protein H696_01113 [Fonticula alba]|uniref:Cytosol aminopeptidase domain-containing protein n=1 Tax=Fonticula alba TaxID=691883 RepID=A0A058ZBB4_FONAL|nr:hypothetical protein H696_01113 [Fonticula alba]KCV71689.1 hypothetical protein H696_01113 [Fonticula alba]|eukprot:XP_009493267.1 hypothetical protein H696_01113 [Fonticula alba]